MNIQNFTDKFPSIKVINLIPHLLNTAIPGMGFSLPLSTMPHQIVGEHVICKFPNHGGEQSLCCNDNMIMANLSPVVKVKRTIYVVILAIFV
jgi:hypothetical protein